MTFVSCTTQPPSPVARPIDFGTRHLVVRCGVYSPNQQLLYNLFDYSFCIFRPDGSVIAASNTSIDLIAKDQTVLWSKKMHVHHMIRENSNGDVMVLTSEIHPYKNVRGRFDAVVKLDARTGEELARFSFFEHFSELLRLRRDAWQPWMNKDDWASYYVPYDVELTHANSVYEIGENALSAKMKPFKPGNFIVNATLLNLILIVSPDLKKVRWTSTYNTRTHFRLHDVQVLPSGRLLVYNNSSTGKDFSESALEEFDVVKKKVVWRYQPTDRSTFKSGALGGVQKFSDGSLLYSDITRGGEIVEVSAGGHETSRRQHTEVSPVTDLPTEIQDAKIYDLSKFLANVIR